MFSLAERAACIHGDVSVEALAHRGDGRECSTDFERETRKNQLLASGGFYSMRDRRIVEGVDRGTIDNLDAGQTSTSSGIVGPHMLSRGSHYDRELERLSGLREADYVMLELCDRVVTHPAHKSDLIVHQYESSILGVKRFIRADIVRHV